MTKHASVIVSPPQEPSVNLRKAWIPFESCMDVSNVFTEGSCGGETITEAGFTLIEVLIALAIIAIAFGALLMASSHTVKQTQYLQTKTLKHWVAMQGITMIQLGLLSPTATQAANEKTTLLGQTFYWRATRQPTALSSVDKLTLTVSSTPNGPFTDPLYAFTYHASSP